MAILPQWPLPNFPALGYDKAPRRAEGRLATRPATRCRVGKTLTQILMRTAT